MRVLVTGGAGFLGGHLVGALCAQGAQVVVVDKRLPAVPVPGVLYRQACITDGRALGQALAGVERVFHLAAEAGMWAPDPDRFLTVNADGTRRLLNLARHAGNPRLVHVSTESILFPSRGPARKACVTEASSTPRHTLASPYQVGKWLAEEAVWQAVATGQNAVVVNPTILVGPGDPWRTPFTRTVLGFLHQRLPAYLQTTLNLVDARDVAQLLLRAAEVGAAGQRFLASGHDVCMSRLLARIEQMSGVPMPRRRVPWRLAWLSAQVGGLWSDRVTRRPPKAPLAGVMIARQNVTYDARKTRATLGLGPRPLEESVGDMLKDLQVRALF